MVLIRAQRRFQTFQLLLKQLFQFYCLLLSFTERKVILLLHRLERNGYGVSRSGRSKHHPCRKRSSVPLEAFKKSVYSLTGLSRDEFLRIFEGTCHVIRQPRNKRYLFIYFIYFIKYFLLRLIFLILLRLFVLALCCVLQYDWLLHLILYVITLLKK